MTKAGIAAPKANSQAYPVDVILPSRLLSPWGARLCVGEAVAKTTSSSLSFLRWRTKRQKRAKVLPKPWPPERALRKVEALCAIQS